MIQAKDIGELFAILRASYGHQWPLGPDDIQVWLRRLGGFNRHQIMVAAANCSKEYPDHPPTLGQFEALTAGPKKRANTYLPAPGYSHAQRSANLTLLKCLTAAEGVSDYTLRRLIELKNALSSEWDEVTQENINNLKRQLWALVEAGR